MYIVVCGGSVKQFTGSNAREEAEKYYALHRGKVGSKEQSNNEYDVILARVIAVKRGRP